MSCPYGAPTGRRTVTVVPTPTWLSREMPPRCSTAIQAAPDKPTPVPGEEPTTLLARYPRSNICAAFSKIALDVERVSQVVHELRDAVVVIDFPCDRQAFIERGPCRVGATFEVLQKAYVNDTRARPTRSLKA